MISKIEISDPLFFDCNAIIYYESPRLMRHGLPERLRLKEDEVQHIHNLLKNKHCVFINLFRFDRLTDRQLEAAINELWKLYPYYSNFSHEELHQVYSKLVYHRQPDDLIFENSNIRKFMRWTQDYFEIPDQEERGLICIKYNPDLDSNDVSYKSLKESSLSLKQFISELNVFDSYDGMNTQQVSEELQGRLDYFSTLNPDTIALRFATEMTMSKINNGNRDDIIRGLEIYDEYYILRDRVRLSRLVASELYDVPGYEFVLQDYNSPQGIRFSLQQVHQALYILFLLKNPDGYHTRHISENPSMFEEIYNRIQNYERQDNDVNFARNTNDDSLIVIISKIKKKIINIFLPSYISQYYIVSRLDVQSPYKINLPNELLEITKLRHNFN